MEEDIYADLPNFNLTESDINDKPKASHVCNCEELEKKFNLINSEFESVKKMNENLERNLASLLKTAKAEIVRKDKMIEELRNQLDNAAFRRNKNGSLGFSTLRSSHRHDTMAEMYESTPLMTSEEDAFMSQQIEPNYTEYKSRKPQNNIEQVPITIFGERLHKRIMDDKEEKKLRTSSKLSSETNVNKISEECIVESDKENGSQSSINNNANECNAVTRSSNSDTSYKNSGKRLNEENNIYKNKRIKTKDNEDMNDDNIDYNSIAQYNTKDDFTKLEDQLCAMYSIKKEQVPFETKHRATSEYRDTKQAQNYRNEWRKEERTSATRDYDDTRTRKGSVDSSRNRTASISNERFNSDYQHDHGYRKNDYRHGSSSSRSFSKSRNDYESSSSHWEKPSRAHRDRKYDDYKYDSRHKNDRSRRGYSKESSSVRTRYSSRERGDLRDRLRHSSDVEERRSKSGSYRSSKYDNHRLKETAANVLENKRSHKNDKAAVEVDSRVSSSRTFVNTTADHSIEKSTEQHSAKNEPCASASSAESTSTHVTTKNQSHLEEGEILDSPSSSPVKKSDSVKNPTSQTVEENVTEGSVQVEDASENMPVDIQGNMESTFDCVKNDLTQLNPADERTSITAETCSHNFVINDLHSDEIVTYPNLSSPGIIGGCNNNGDYECENCIDRNVEDDIVSRSVEETYNFNNENIIRTEEVGDADAEDASEIDKVATMLSFANSVLPDDNNIRQTDREDVASSTSEVAQVETVPNRDNVDESRVSNGNETSPQVPDNSNAEASRSCLGDHNYVRDTVIDTSNLDVALNTSEHRESVSDTAKETPVSKETGAEGTVNIQQVDTRRTTSTTSTSKKDQNGKTVVISRRRRPVILSDNKASMTVLINRSSVESSLVNNSTSDKSDTALKPRACKLARTIKPPCK